MRRWWTSFAILLALAGVAGCQKPRPVLLYYVGPCGLNAEQIEKRHWGYAAAGNSPIFFGCGMPAQCFYFKPAED
jgi:hypothetical protein